MILQDIIAQSSENNAFEEQPSIKWGASLTDDYPMITGLNHTTTTVFSPSVLGVDNYNHVNQIGECYGAVHIIFNSSPNNEPDVGRVKYSKSLDYGLTWTEPIVILDFQDDETKDYNTNTVRQTLPSNLIVLEGELYAVVDINDFQYGGLGRIGVGTLVRKINSNSTFGTIEWIENKDGSFNSPLSISGYPSYSFNQVLRTKLRYIMTTDAIKTSAWYFSVPTSDHLYTRNFKGSQETVEPSTIQLNNGQYVKIHRPKDEPRDFKLASTSLNGVDWSDLYTTEIPDSPSKTVFLNTGDVILGVGNNTGAPNRNPLFLAVSDQSLNFTNSNVYSLDSTTKVLEFNGFGKGGGSQYPSMMQMSNGRILVSYSRGKEDMVVSVFDKPIIN